MGVSLHKIELQKIKLFLLDKNAGTRKKVHYRVDKSSKIGYTINEQKCGYI